MKRACVQLRGGGGARDRLLLILLLGKGDLHGGSGRDLEALERVSGRGRLQLVLEFDNRNVVTPGHQSNLCST